MTDEPRLNSLDRFRKKSDRLVLEEHGHCEVPAGCGGVILRWRNPHALQSAVLWLYAPVPADLLLDGEPPGRGRVDLTVGRHVLALALENVNLSAGLLLFAAVREGSDFGVQDEGGARERPIRVLSADDGTWKYALDKPDDGWATAAFDDAAWPALVKHPTPTLGQQDRGRYACEHCAELGAVCLGLPLPAEEREQPTWWQRWLGYAVPTGEPVVGNVWVRKAFEVVPPGGAA
jgi:hypothetical protein